MPMPLWWGHINKRIFNPRELRKGDRPVIHHVGRTSGQEYQTPLDAHSVDGGFLFILVYGSQSDWVQNILTSGRARLTKDGEEFELTDPRILEGPEAWPMLGLQEQPRSVLKLNEFLFMAAN